MKSKYYSFKGLVVELRKSGKTYGEIRKAINQPIPKSTLSDWCHHLYLKTTERKILEESVKENSKKGMEVARMVNKKRREKYLESINFRNKHLSQILENTNVAKVVLSTLYLAEGAKSLTRGSLYFGNSDPFIINMFLSLLRKCYKIDESKFRCTVQCRSDQNIDYLEKFWSAVTNISLKNFYKT